MDALAGFVDDARSRRFAYGSMDCGTLCADWVMAKWGIDPAAEWRGRYKTALGCNRLLKRRGGIVVHFDACLTGVGARRVDEYDNGPERGDIAIVATDQGLTGGIILGITVALATEQGIRVRHRSITPIIAAWRI